MTRRANWNSNARVERIEFGKSQQGDPFFKITKLLRGTFREYWFPLRDYELERAQIMAALSEGGEERWAENDWGLFNDAVKIAAPKLSVPTRPGWHEDCFVLPNGRVLGLPNWRVFLPSADGSRSGLFDDDGRVEEWEAIPALAHGNSLLTMAIAFALTGPIAALLGIDAPCIQLIGSPGFAMSVIEDVVAAMWRRSRVEDAGFVESWNGPRRALDKIAEERAQTMLVIDDATPAEGAHSRFEDDWCPGHARNERPKTMMKVARSAPVFSVSTNIDAARARRQGAARGGLEDRLIDIALDNSQSWLEELHGYPDDKTFLSDFHWLVRTHSGFLANFIVGYLDEMRYGDGWISKRHRRRKQYLKIARKSFAGRGDHEARHQAFATIFAAGESLLVGCELVPWSRSDLVESLLKCEAAAIDTANAGL